MLQVLKLYQSGDFAQEFQKIRIWDAPYEIIEKYLPNKGSVVDLGCGDGLLANYIALSRPNTKVYGLDINKDRVSEAQKGIKNAKFIHGDITQAAVPKADVIILMHVLHHLLSFEHQIKVLKDCENKLKKGGVLIIGEISNKPFYKYIFTWLVDHVAVPILFERKIYNSKIFFRKDGEWLVLLNSLGFKCRIVSAHKQKPFSHIILICKK